MLKQRIRLKNSRFFNSYRINQNKHNCLFYVLESRLKKRKRKNSYFLTYRGGYKLEEKTFLIIELVGNSNKNGKNKESIKNEKEKNKKKKHRQHFDSIVTILILTMTMTLTIEIVRKINQFVEAFRECFSLYKIINVSRDLLFHSVLLMSNLFDQE